jgi:glutathione reductase (NADPH)
MPMSEFDTDLLVIGAGSGGVRAARMAAQRGATVTVVEAEGRAGMGGTCVNLGCIPKKLYAYAAHYGESFEEAHGFGWSGPRPQFDWETLKANRRREIARLNGSYQGLLDSHGVTTVHGRATLLGPHRAAIDTAGGARTLTARHILIATGGRPHVPAFPGREHVLTSNDMFDLPVFPQRLVVVGGGYIACEFASIFRALGAAVTQLYRGPQILRGFDDEVRRFLAAEMMKKNIDLRLQCNVRRVDRTGNGLRVTLDDGNVLEADAVLYATGRTPNVAGLGLDAVGVEQDSDGAIKVNADYRTNVASIHAVGDVISPVQLTPVALGEAMVVVDQLFPPPAGKAPRAMSYEFIPTAVFTQPSVATVGFGEADARRQFGDIRVYRSEFRALKHTLTGSTERTLVKLIVDNATDRVVGLHMVGSDAGEIVQGFAVAMKAGATKAVFDSTLGIHPTAAEEFVTLREPVPAAKPALGAGIVT